MSTLDATSLKTISEQVQLRSERLKFEAVRARAMLSKVKKAYNTCSKIIAFIAGFSGMAQAVMQILDYRQSYIDIVPIVLSLIISIFAVWIRFNDYPKRMEKLCITIEAIDASVRDHLTAQITTLEDWDRMNESYANALAKANAVGRPEEQDEAGDKALKYMQREQKRQNRFKVTMSDPNYGLTKKQIKSKEVEIPELLMLEEGSLDKRKKALQNSPPRRGQGVLGRILSNFSNHSTGISNIGDVDVNRVDRDTDKDMMKADQDVTVDQKRRHSANAELIRKAQEAEKEKRRRDSRT